METVVVAVVETPSHRAITTRDFTEASATTTREWISTCPDAAREGGTASTAASETTTGTVHVAVERVFGV
jgi:hypothetical protein